jgi:hypothetical protein
MYMISGMPFLTQGCSKKSSSALAADACALCEVEGRLAVFMCGLAAAELGADCGGLLGCDE